MLARLETIYLGILRVAVLIVATICIVVAIGAAVTTVPSLLNQFRGVRADDPTGTPLKDFIDERRLTSATSSTDTSSSTEGSSTAASIDPQIKRIATSLHDYLPGVGNPIVSYWEDGIKRVDDATVSGDPTYIDSLEVLVGQLKESKGKKLSAEQIEELIDWHKARYESAFQASATKKAAAAGTTYIGLAAAGSFFLFFILVIFVFLFVKIERSLRIVHTFRTGTDDAA